MVVRLLFQERHWAGSFLRFGLSELRLLDLIHRPDHICS
jgi:hypothetical protein